MAIDYEVREHIGYITLNMPEKANILDHETSDQISQAWKEAWEDREVRVVILTGTGDRHFCAGHNLQQVPGVSQSDREFNMAYRTFWPEAGTVHGTKVGADPHMGDHYPQIWKPVIAAINGWAAGAGLYLTLGSTDIRIASAEHARFKFALLRLGGLGGGPGATLLLQQLRYIDAMKMLLTDQEVDAAEALRIGLVNEVVPHAQLMARAEEIARQIVAMPPVAARMMKEFANRFRDLPFDQKWHVQNLMTSLLQNMTNDGEEGRRAFNEKRPANYTGQLRARGEPFPEPSPEDWERLDDLRRRRVY
jgi:enoyl-CoA hydratase/carnithine racemase